MGGRWEKTGDGEGEEVHHSALLMVSEVTLTCLEYLKRRAKPKALLGENVSTGNINQRCVEVLQDIMSSKDTRFGIVFFYEFRIFCTHHCQQQQMCKSSYSLSLYLQHVFFFYHTKHASFVIILI